MYTHDRTNRQSTVKELYTIQRDGKNPEALDGDSWIKPYVLSAIRTEAAMPDTLNFTIYKTYQRVDDMSDIISYPIFEKDIQTESQSPKRYQHDGPNRLSYEYVRCFMVHEGDPIDFGCYLDKRHHHLYQLRDERIIHHSPIDLVNERVSLTIEEDYQRADQTSYLKNSEVHNVPIVLQSKNDVDENNRVARHLAYNVRYKNMSRDLPPHIKYYSRHRYGEVLDSPHARIPLSEEKRRITKIEVYFGGFVDALRFFTETSHDIASWKVGGNNNFSRNFITFEDDEFLIGIFGGRGAVIDSIGFITNKRRHGPFGRGGNPFEKNLQREVSFIEIGAGWWERDHITIFNIPTKRDFAITDIQIH